MSNKPEMLVWAEPIERGDLRLVCGDIEEALSWFQEQMRTDAKLVILNPKNEQFASQLGNGVKVDYSTGCLPREVWLSSSDSHALPPISLSDAPEFKYTWDKSLSRPITPMGRPKLDLPMEQIRKFQAKGLSSRKIADKLRTEGLSISYKTIQRAINKQEE